MCVYKSILIISILGGIILIGMSNTERRDIPVRRDAGKVVIKIILGSTREGRMSDKIAQALCRFVDTRTDIRIEILDLRDYSLPFLEDSISPAARKDISNAVIRKWSDKIQEGQAYVIISPEYNSGYPGVLKNALDLLYKEWNGKPVAFIAYSGGASGGTFAVTQLRQVVHALHMVPIASDIFLPYSSQLFDQQGNFLVKGINQKFSKSIDQLIALVK
jgi:NAD(P)H-dependent FMN reductase